MDVTLSDSEDDEEIISLLAENGIRIKNNTKIPVVEKKSKDINILEDIIIYRPDDELLQAINITQEPYLVATEPHEQEANLGFVFTVTKELNTAATEVLTPLFDTASTSAINIFEDESNNNKPVTPKPDETPVQADPTILSDANRNVSNNLLVEIRDPNHGQETTGDEIQSPTVINEIVTPNKCKHKKRAVPEEWKKNIAKRRRMHGEAYTGHEKKDNKIVAEVEKGARQIGIKCTSSFCKKSNKRSCSKFQESDRLTIFENFWKELDWEAKKTFVASMVDKISVKQRTAGESHKRQESYEYYLKLNDQKHQVCKSMFINTLGIKDSMLKVWISQADGSGITLTETNKQTSKRGKKKSTHEPTSIGISQNEHLKQFFDAIPKLPSHYCRSTTTKLYLEPIFECKTHVYNVYKERCSIDEVNPVSDCYFYRMFDESNLSITSPKKDKCDVCCGFETKNVPQAIYDQHMQKKKAARLEKDNDKKLALEGKVTVLTVDLQSVKVCPKVQASAIYFKTKLCLHNFTVYNLATQEATCYWWNECEGELQASNFASCLVDYIQEKVSKTNPLIIFSDGCTAQNRNAVMSNALLDLSMKENMAITQKYLEKGHTQMECDSVHSVIEIKQKKRDIFLPYDYATLTKEAKKKSPLYEAKYLTHDFFQNYSGLQRYSSIRPGKKVGEPTVTDIRQLCYDPTGKIQYKLNFADELQDLPVRCKPGNNITSPMYTDRLPLKPRKWKDLQDLKSVLPKDCHAYYDNLPKSTE